ncbi:hypothetical protein [Arcanobacterium pinnipediorum]|uniref:hypothetical protein n=1 Tax=Arcanobacterium pinnipediorum TaxID=1503041 RepID=UPI00338F057F
MFSRKIVGWALSETMTTQALPLQALNQASSFQQRLLQDWYIIVITVPKYVSIAYNETLSAYGINASTGTLGDSYDNALASKC